MFINRPHVLFNGRFTWLSLFGIDRKNFFKILFTRTSDGNIIYLT
jgi:hypothetical protein